MLQDFIRETEAKLKFKIELREKNLSAAENRGESISTGKLDSSLKKNTSFVKKLRNLTDSQSEALLKDLKTLNLSKYIGEAASALTDAKLKMSDINTALLICSALHQRYAELSPTLMDSWMKVLPGKKDEKVANPSKLRVDLRFFADLVSVGVFVEKEGLGVLANLLTLLVNNDPDDHPNLSIILSFCRHCGDDYAGILPRKYRLLSEQYGLTVPMSTVLRAERQKACRQLLKDYFSSVSKHLLKEHRRFRDLKRQNDKWYQTKGEVSDDKRAQEEAAKSTFEKLLSNVQNLSDLLDEDMPTLPEDRQDDLESSMPDFFLSMKGSEFDGNTGLFEDDETKQFYEHLPALMSVVPGRRLLKVQETQAPHNKDLFILFLELEAMKEQEEVTKEVEEEGDGSATMKQLLDSLLSSLPSCVNRELIDQAAENFCLNLNTKSNRRKLTKTLFTVHRTRYDLLPFYARFVATLNPLMPDISTDLCGMLMSDFKWHVRKKDQINIESKLKTVRFIGELVKFQMFAKSEALQCMKMLLYDFTHHNIEMACSLLETCGRFLYRSPDSHHRTKVYLEVMMRKKVALHLDSRYSTMIENAFYYSNPPDVKGVVQLYVPPMHRYIRKLLYKDLSKTTIERVLRQLRKLDWNDPEIRSYAVKCLTEVWQVRYSAVHCCANLLAGLAPYHEDVAIRVVDAVLEDIRLGMELNLPKHNQRRISMVKYLGELYNYRMIESAVIFKTLYSFITLGVTLHDDEPAILDLPECLFRVRLTCTLLDACGQYFDRGSSKKKLDCFITYFQRYYWFKRSRSVWTELRPFPLDVVHVVEELFDQLRPKLILCTSYEEACEAASELDQQFRAKFESIVPKESTIESSADNSALPAIQELEDDETGDDLLEDFSQRQAETGDSQSQEMTASLSHPAKIGVLSAGPKLIKCSEDDDFMATFDKMMTDTIQARNQETVKAPQVDIPVPNGEEEDEEDEEEEEQAKEEVKLVEFKLMVRRGHKQQLSNLNIPMSAAFACKYKERTAQEQMEKEKMKRMTLSIHERQEEEDYQEMIAALNRPLAPNINRERRSKYHHPKGAPDADLIFGSSASNKR
ncbi:hypothetical protein CAPTEDRAFT_168822 [Capitella teleta]|uniref:Regulator of nonsense transcripts 2 n=1 Tax=Capitella teleta TaxID=283909 RepID=R7UP31_CAPTE|nr:hypothetical protein CAPTEDRAFT_168822 [Capitella teleta]|eukprot:ELU05692.1 hypothetical protein CAPTEDRAFT_168822 [Capitella teleta]